MSDFDPDEYAQVSREVDAAEYMIFVRWTIIASIAAFVGFVPFLNDPDPGRLLAVPILPSIACLLYLRDRKRVFEDHGRGDTWRVIRPVDVPRLIILFGLLVLVISPAVF